MNREDYIKEGLRQLSDENFYVKLQSTDPIEQYQNEIQATLNKLLLKDEISPKAHAYLSPTGTKTPEFYFLPKVHKAKITGRPIISGNNSPTERIAAFVDEHIKSLVPLIKSYVRDFIKKIENFNLTGHYFLVTMDVTSLYTNIPNHEGLVAVARALIRHRPSFKISHMHLLELLKVVVHKKHFQFNNEHFLQIGGTAMGTKVAPSFANIFMGNLEARLLQEAETRLNITFPLYL